MLYKMIIIKQMTTYLYLNVLEKPIANLMPITLYVPLNMIIYFVHICFKHCMYKIIIYTCVI